MINPTTKKYEVFFTHRNGDKGHLFTFESEHSSGVTYVSGIGHNLTDDGIAVALHTCHSRSRDRAIKQLNNWIMKMWDLDEEPQWLERA